MSEIKSILSPYPIGVQQFFSHEVETATGRAYIPLYFSTEGDHNLNVAFHCGV